VSRPPRQPRPDPGDEPHDAGDERTTIALGRFDALVSYGLMQILGHDPAFRIIGSNLDNPVLERVVAQHMPRIVLLDESAAGDLAILARLRKSRAAPGIGVLAQKPTRAYGTQLLAAEASCLPKEAPATDILASVRALADGKRLFVSDGKVIERKYPTAAAPLTPREIEVLEYLSRGRSSPEVAHALHLSVETVRTHTKRIRSKLGVRSKRDLIGLAIPTHAEIE
jgi:DNA-binding NarL/FixJ family response regulator